MDKKDTTDYKQIAYSLEYKILTMYEDELSFIKKMQKLCKKAFDENCISSKEMLKKMIDDSIDYYEEKIKNN